MLWIGGDVTVVTLVIAVRFFEKHCSYNADQ